MIFDKSAGTEPPVVLVNNHSPHPPSDQPVKPNNEVANQPIYLSGESLGTDTPLNLIRQVNLNGTNDLPKSFAPAAVSQDGSLTFDAPKLSLAEVSERQEQAPEAPTLQQSSLDDIEHSIDRSPNLKITRAPDGTVRKTDGNNEVEISADGTKDYATSANGVTEHHVVRPDGSFTSFMRGHGSQVITEGGADGSCTQTVDTPDSHENTEWGPGGQFKQRVSTDKKTGRTFISRPGDNGELVTEELQRA